MKITRIFDGVFARGALCRSVVSLALLLAATQSAAGAGSIFDDDWVPPPGSHSQHIEPPTRIPPPAPQPAPVAQPGVVQPPAVGVNPNKAPDVVVSRRRSVP